MRPWNLSLRRPAVTYSTEFSEIPVFYSEAMLADAHHSPIALNLRAVVCVFQLLRHAGWRMRSGTLNKLVVWNRMAVTTRKYPLPTKLT